MTMLCPACLAASPYNRHGSRTCGRVRDWEVFSVTVSGAGLHVSGWNHSSGAPFSWGFQSSRAHHLHGERRFDFTALVGQASAVTK